MKKRKRHYCHQGTGKGTGTGIDTGGSEESDAYPSRPRTDEEQTQEAPPRRPAPPPEESPEYCNNAEKGDKVEMGRETSKFVLQRAEVKEVINDSCTSFCTDSSGQTNKNYKAAPSSTDALSLTPTKLQPSNGDQFPWEASSALSSHSVARFYSCASPDLDKDDHCEDLLFANPRSPLFKTCPTTAASTSYSCASKTKTSHTKSPSKVSPIKGWMNVDISLPKDFLPPPPPRTLWATTKRTTSAAAAAGVQNDIQEDQSDGKDDGEGECRTESGARTATVFAGDEGKRTASTIKAEEQCQEVSNATTATATTAPTTLASTAAEGANTLVSAVASDKDKNNDKSDSDQDQGHNHNNNDNDILDPNNKTFSRRKNLKNTRARMRAHNKKDYIDYLKQQKEELGKTLAPAEETELQKWQNRRTRKNDQSRERALQRKLQLQQILAKPEIERTPSEQDFAQLELQAKSRKNEGDRLRRQRRRLLVGTGVFTSAAVAGRAGKLKLTARGPLELPNGLVVPPEEEARLALQLQNNKNNAQQQLVSSTDTKTTARSSPSTSSSYQKSFEYDKQPKQELLAADKTAGVIIANSQSQPRSKVAPLPLDTTLPFANSAQLKSAPLNVDSLAVTVGASYPSLSESDNHPNAIVRREEVDPFSGHHHYVWQNARVRSHEIRELRPYHHGILYNPPPLPPLPPPATGQFAAAPPLLPTRSHYSYAPSERYHLGHNYGHGYLWHTPYYNYMLYSNCQHPGAPQQQQQQQPQQQQQVERFGPPK